MFGDNILYSLILEFSRGAISNDTYGAHTFWKILISSLDH